MVLTDTTKINLVSYIIIKVTRKETNKLTMSVCPCVTKLRSDNS